MDRITHFKWFAFLFFILVISCRGEPKGESSAEETTREFIAQFNEFYETYSNADISFLEWYASDVVSIDTNGDQIIGREAYRDAIEQMFDQYEIDLLSYSEPDLFMSDSQIVSVNDYEELFISKSTGDTTRVAGTWIGVWQNDGERWVVSMNTFHLKDDD